MGEVHGYYNEDTEDYDLPEEIDGVRVGGYEDEWVISEELVDSPQYEPVRFCSMNDPKLMAWLDESGWNNPKVWKEIGEILESSH